MSTFLVVFLVKGTSTTKPYGRLGSTENNLDDRIVDNLDDDYGIEADHGIVKEERVITKEPRTVPNSVVFSLDGLSTISFSLRR